MRDPGEMPEDFEALVAVLVDWTLENAPSKSKRTLVTEGELRTFENQVGLELPHAYRVLAPQACGLPGFLPGGMVIASPSEIYTPGRCQLATGGIGLWQAWGASLFDPVLSGAGTEVAESMVTLLRERLHTVVGRPPDPSARAWLQPIEAVALGVVPSGHRDLILHALWSGGEHALPPLGAFVASWAAPPDHIIRGPRIDTRTGPLHLGFRALVDLPQEGVAFPNSMGLLFPDRLILEPEFLHELEDWAHTGPQRAPGASLGSEPPGMWQKLRWLLLG